MVYHQKSHELLKRLFRHIHGTTTWFEIVDNVTQTNIIAAGIVMISQLDFKTFIKE